MAYFDKYGVEFSDDRRYLVECPKKLQGKYIIPNGVLKIGRDAPIKFNNMNPEMKNEGHGFLGCKELVNINMPNTVTDIETGAFLGCHGLKDLNLPNSLTRIGESAFAFCHNLNSINIPKGVANIECCAFENCINLKHVILPSSIISIGEGVFWGCNALKKIFIPIGQKKRFSQMKGLAELANILEEKEDPKLYNSQRTWEEVNAEYRAYFERRQKENPNIQNKNGGTPLEFPPFGIELSFQEYSQFKKDGHTIPFWMFWCKSGNEIHELARLYGPIGGIGLYTPRKGYYKVVGIEGEGNDARLVCYYNLFSFNEFLEEEDEKVRVKQKPLFNKRSSCAGPIEIGDIVHVKSTELVEDIYDGRTYQAYKIIWEFV